MRVKTMLGGRASWLRRVSLVVLLLVLAGWSVPVRAEPLQPPATGLGEITRFRLANGLDVVLQEMHRQPRVAVIVGYEVGRRDDPPNRHGLAHLVEHMTYRRSRHLGPSQAMMLLQNLGASDLSGETASDSTSYVATVPAAGLATALWVESERMAFTLEQFDLPSLELEKRILRSERRLKFPHELEFRQAAATAMFGEGHPYARNAGEEELDNISLDDVRWFYQAHYRPARAHLILVGDFKTAEARALVTKYFEPIANPVQDWPREELPQRATVQARESNLGYTGRGFDRLSIGWFVPADTEGARTAIDVVVKVLRARLTKTIRRLKPGRLKVGAIPLAGGTYVEVELTLSSDASFQYVEQAVRSELTGLWGGDFSAAFDSAKRDTWLSLLERAESPVQLARAQLRELFLRGQPLELSHVLASVTKLSVDDALALRPRFADNLLATTRLRRYGAVPLNPDAEPSRAEEP